MRDLSLAKMMHDEVLSEIYLFRKKKYIDSLNVGGESGMREVFVFCIKFNLNWCDF